jgi:8-oxo-dGTP pyrophosphatase MutT (NUDIX family)
MSSLLENTKVREAFARLEDVRLNPRRHTAANARAHSEAVATHAGRLARANGCSEAEAHLLEDLGRVHDIGKITGTAQPARSLDVLAQCGVSDPTLLSLVKWHDTNLPWSRAAARGEAPSDKAWRRLAAEVDVRLLALFMVADRVDAPPGWRRNAPLQWFLTEARTKNLLGDLALDLPDHASEVCAGGALVRPGPEVLVVRVRAEAFELPKGGIEWDELPEEAAVREAREEAGLEGPLTAVEPLGEVDYFVGHRKRVRYFRLTGDALEAPLPPRTRERRWVSSPEVEKLPLVNEELRPILFFALGRGS